MGGSTVVKAACGILFLALVVKVRECQEQHTHTKTLPLYTVHVFAQQPK